LSAQALGPFQGDRKTHIFRINTDPSAPFFSPDGSSVVQAGGEAAVTLDFVCQSCHGSSTKEELALFAKDFHDNLGNNQYNGSLANFGLDPGLSGTWWNPAKSGEGFLLEVDATQFLYGSFYTYGPDGTQTWLIAFGSPASATATTLDVTVVIPEGGTWGDPSGAQTGNAWGTGTFSFPTCTAGNVSLVPNADMTAMGFTAQAYDLERILPPGIACPTFANDQ
jgi:hypothetical protein